MGFIGHSIPKLESWFESFSIEVFASILKPEWVQEALATCGRQGERDRKLSAPFTLWLTVGMGLYRSLSIQNVIHRLGNLRALDRSGRTARLPRRPPTWKPEPG